MINSLLLLLLSAGILSQPQSAPSGSIALRATHFDRPRELPRGGQRHKLSKLRKEYERELHEDGIGNRAYRRLCARKSAFA